MSPTELAIVPFHSWNCLSIELSHREVDIVIKDQLQMDCLLKFVIRNLRTLDGKRGSANKILDQMNRESVAKYKKDKNRAHISESVRLKL